MTVNSQPLSCLGGWRINKMIVFQEDLVAELKCEIELSVEEVEH